MYSVLDLQQVSPSVLFVIRQISLELHNKSVLKAPLFTISMWLIAINLIDGAIIHGYKFVSIDISIL